MPAVLSTLWVFPFPYDVLREIALNLPPKPLLKLVLSCKPGFFVGAPLLYRSVEAWFDPVNYHDQPYRTENRPIRFLMTLINSTLPKAGSNFPYATHLVTLCYGSWSMACDFNALPLLAEALRYTFRLRHLRIDVARDSVPMVLDIFRRSSIIITPSTALPGFNHVDRRPLPFLESIRTSRLAIADGLMQYRAIQTVVVDLSIKRLVLAKFLRAEAPWTPTHLRQLSLRIAGEPNPNDLVVGLLNAFPQLQHLAIRVSAAYCVSMMTGALRVLTDLPNLGQSLRALSVNHASQYTLYDLLLEDVHSVIPAAFPVRPALAEIVLGSWLWERKSPSEWSFTSGEDELFENWPWLLRHINDGQWAVFGQAVRAYHYLG